MGLMEGLHENPFAALSLIAAPAVLTNASSLLALGTSNRFARAVDRQRQLSALLEGDKDGADEQTGALRLRQLHRSERRGQLLLGALTSFYVSLGAFAAASLVSLLGAVIVPAGFGVLSAAIRVTALAIGVVGLGGLVSGCTSLVRETRITLAALREEAAFSAERFHAKYPHASRGDDVGRG